MTHLTTPLLARTYAVETTPIPDLGRVIYRVARVGTFTVEHDKHAYPDTARMRNLHVTYGLHEQDRWESGYRLLPEHPVMCGVPIGGGSIFDPYAFTPERLDEHRARWPRVVVRRGPAGGTVGDEVHGSAPAATAERVSDLVGGIGLHFLARHDHDDLVEAQHRRMAAGRLASHQRTIDGLLDQIAKAEAALAHERSLADAQLAFLMPRGDNALRVVGAT